MISLDRSRVVYNLYEDHMFFLILINCFKAELLQTTSRISVRFLTILHTNHQ
jgi:hypothetical protein